MVIEDVITGGTSLHEVLPRLKDLNVQLRGVIVGVDRQEKGPGNSELSALEEIGELYDVPVARVVTLSEVISYLHNRTVLGKVWIDDQIYRKITDYRDRYGAVEASTTPGPVPVSVLRGMKSQT